MSVGISFPIRLNGRGGMKMSKPNLKNEHLEEILRLRIETKIGERVMNPTLGSTIDMSLYEDEDLSILSLLKYELVDLINSDDRFNITEEDITFNKQNEEELNISLECKIQGETYILDIPIKLY